MALGRKVQPEMVFSNPFPVLKKNYKEVLIDLEG
jgi:hypothetical protein